MLLEWENILLKGQYEKESNVKVLKELHGTCTLCTLCYSGSSAVTKG